MTIHYFTLTHVFDEDEAPGEFRLLTAALLDCGLCGRNISGMGGPGNGVICAECGTALRRGQLKGAVAYNHVLDPSVSPPDVD